MFRFRFLSEERFRQLANGGSDPGHRNNIRQPVRHRSTNLSPASTQPSGRKPTVVPSIYLSNCNHVLNKLDELFILTTNTALQLDIICLTETWLDANTPDSVCQLPDFHLYRKDRSTGLGGGVLCYVRNNIVAQRVERSADSDLAIDTFKINDFEVLWLILRPRLLPRPCSQLIVVTVYCPPWYEVGRKKALSKYITDELDRLARLHPNAGFVVVGDFNTLDTSFFARHHDFKQLVKGNTRGNKILDKIFTNCYTFFSEAEICAPLGRSDHNSVMIRSTSEKREPVGSKIVIKRNFSNAAYEYIERDLCVTNWSTMYRMPDCQSQANFFYETVCSVVDKYAPTQEIVFKNNDKPWVTPKFKDIVNQRNAAFAVGDRELYNKLRNQVNRLGMELRRNFFNRKVDSLKNQNSRKWWSEIKSISGFNNKCKSDYANVVVDGKQADEQLIAELSSRLLIAVNNKIPALSLDTLAALRDRLEECPVDFVISEFEVYQVMSKLSKFKASLCDSIDNNLLRVLAPTLSGPVCALINSSIRQGLIPEQWKLSRVSLIPKVNPVKNLESDLRPISITCPISKVAEFFIDQFFEQHFDKYLDDDQYGCTRGRSTLYALIQLTHILFDASDNSQNIIRVLFVDFRKAFEMIDHTVLCRKFDEYNFPPHLSLWMLSFLSCRRQFVKVGDSVSEIKWSHAGAPQGTRAGPNVFKLLINDLCFELPTIKYVDDVSVASVSSDPNNENLHNALGVLDVWSNKNGMLINTDKTKEMIVYFGRNYSDRDFKVLTCGGRHIERVDVFKLLGVMISSDLTWKAHVSFIISKACRRLFVIYQLVRAGIGVADVISVYCSLIRSVLEYCSPVWHCGLTQGQSSEIESVQKRVLKIVFPDLSYNNALAKSGLEKLSFRREKLSIKTFNGIKSQSHVLNRLLVRKSIDERNMKTRDTYPYVLPLFKTDRAVRSLIWNGIKKRW